LNPGTPPKAAELRTPTGEARLCGDGQQRGAYTPATARQKERIDMAKSKTAKQPAATKERLTDDELKALIKQFVAKLPEATSHSVYKVLRASGKSVSGGRVREAMAALHSKPKAARKPASK
jgi:hypothetical protein